MIVSRLRLAEDKRRAPTAETEDAPEARMARHPHLDSSHSTPGRSSPPAKRRRCTGEHGGIFNVRELLLIDLDQAPPDECSDCWFASQVERLRTVAIGWERIRLLEPAS